MESLELRLKKSRLRAAKIGNTYEVVAGGDTIGYSVRGVLRSKNIKWKGDKFWHFEGGAFECLIRKEDIIELNEVRRMELW
jgi:hypothetical protein